jgi:hypothetical protein
MLVNLLMLAGPTPVDAATSSLSAASQGAGADTLTLARQELGAQPEAAPRYLSMSADYGPAVWVPAAASNYSLADRNHDYPVDMIVIHDIEGSASSAIKTFQDPNRHGSAHYVISYSGNVWQMALENDIAWHAGNWDYNTRSIGIEHEGYAWTPGLYTTAEYIASAHLAASICSRWGVPMDRAHVIGHSQVPDPFHSGLYGGSDHHTDPGPYWSWSYFMNLAQRYASALPSPPRLGPDPLAVPEDRQATVTWHPAHSCHEPVDGYTVIAQPGNIVQNLPPSATSATFNGLQNGTRYTFTVSTQNSYGQDTLQSNPVIVSPPCANPKVTASVPSPQPAGIKIQLAATSSSCTNPQYEFWLQNPAGTWVLKRSFGGPTWTWDTRGFPTGVYTAHVWANQQTSDDSTWQSYAEMKYTILAPPPCGSASLTPANLNQPAAAPVDFTASSTVCITPLYAFWLQGPNGAWTLKRQFATTPTWSWSTAGLAPGRYTIHVWANQEGHSTASWEAYGSATVVLTACASASISPTSTSQAAGTVVAFNAGSVGCVNPNYEYWIQYPNGTWYLKRGWGSAAFTWSTAGLVPGKYTVHVWANNIGDSGSTWEAYATSIVTLTGCTSASLTPASGTSTVGTMVSFTAGSSGCPTPVYEFWLRYPNATWHLMRGFGAATWTWSTAGFPKGTYVVHVWANNQGADTKTWESYGSATYKLA